MGLREAVTDFKVGDPVEIWNFGALIWTKTLFGKNTVIDIMPELVGQRGVIDGEDTTQGIKHYSVKGPIKHTWYSENQLRKINMNDIEKSIVQGQNGPGLKGEMTGDSKVLPIFPEYHMGGTQRTLRVESYVRKEFNGRWYLIPVITQWESPTPMFGPDVVKDVIKRQQIEAYKVLLYYRYAKPMTDAFGMKLNTQLLDINQEDERNRLELELEYKKSLSDYVRSLWIKYIKRI